MNAVRALIDLADATNRRVDDFIALLDKAADRSTSAPARADPMTVIFFDTWPAYEVFARRKGFAVNQSSPGFFDEASDCSYLYNFANAEAIRTRRDALLRARAELIPAAANASPSDEKARAAREERLRRIRELESQIDATMDVINATVTRHEIAHQVLFHRGIQRLDDPGRRWLKEGLAMQFETTDAPNRHRLTDFRAIDPAKIKLPLVTLVTDPVVIGPGCEHPQEAYAMAWALAYYLSREEPRAFAEYLRQSPVEGAAGRRWAFESAFGRIDDNFEQRFQRFMRQVN